jgi:hypothetical protein
MRIRTITQTVSTIVAIGGVGVGCSVEPRSIKADQDLTPPPADAATLLRGWEPTVREYPSGHARAGTTTFKYEPRPGQSSWRYYFVDTGAFFANLFTSPVTAFVERGPVEYGGVDFTPGYTLNPVLPASGTVPFSPDVSGETRPETDSRTPPEAPTEEQLESGQMLESGDMPEAGEMPESPDGVDPVEPADPIEPSIR